MGGEGGGEEKGGGVNSEVRIDGPWERGVGTVMGIGVRAGTAVGKEGEKLAFVAPCLFIVGVSGFLTSAVNPSATLEFSWPSWPSSGPSSFWVWDESKGCSPFEGKSAKLSGCLGFFLRDGSREGGRRVGRVQLMHFRTRGLIKSFKVTEHRPFAVSQYDL